MAVSLLLMCACTHLPVAEKKQTIFFPPPPETARLQYLGSISSERDLPRKQSGFADLVLGEKPETFPLVKPIAALLAGPRLYVCDTVLNTVITYDLATGEGGNLKGDRGNGKIQQPNNITVDENGKFYVCDKLRGALLVYGPDEEFIAAWGRPKEVQPVAVAIGRQHLYVCDVKDHEIEVWDRATGTYQRAFGEKGTGPGQFFFPTQIALDSHGNLWVTDTGNFRVQEFTPEGKFIKQIGKHGTALGHFAWPKGMALDTHDQLFVVDARFANVQVFDPNGKLLLFFGAPGPDGGNLDLPAGLHVQPWPAGVPWLQERLAPGFQPEELVTVVSQKGAGFVNFFAVARQSKDIP